MLNLKYRNKLNWSKPSTTIDFKQNIAADIQVNIKTLTIDNSDRIPHTNLKPSFWTSPENKNDKSNDNQEQERQK